MPLHHDVFLHFDIGLPAAYKNIGMVVVRGPFAALTPSDQLNGHVLASGRFRKVASAQGEIPSEAVSPDKARSLYAQAIEEASTYFPFLQQATYRGPVVGTRTAYFDEQAGHYSSRALVFPNHGGIDGYHVVLGGKISCLTDIVAPLTAILEDKS